MNNLFVTIAIILFPGLLSALFCDKIANHSIKWGYLKYCIYSFILGVFCYLFLQLFIFLFYLITHFVYNVPLEKFAIVLSTWSVITPSEIKIKLSEVVFAVLLSPIVAIFVSYINNYKLILRACKKLGVTNKFGDENLFSYYLNTDEVLWVYVRDASLNQTYKGHIWALSENDHLQEIVLIDVSVYVYETSEHLYDLPSIYIAKPSGTFTIEAIPQAEGADNGEKTTQ